MSDKKEYSSEEVAKLMLERAQEVLSKNEDIVKLVKSKNSAHEIDLGSEPSSDTAQAVDEQSSESSSEAPVEGEKAEKKESSEDSEMEDTPLQGDSDSDTEDKEEDKEEDKKEDKFSFKKNETGMFEVQYQRLTKSSDNAEIEHATEKPTKMSDAQNATFGSSIRSGKKGSMEGHKGDKSPGQIQGEKDAKARREKIKAEAKKSEGADHKVDEADIDFDTAKKNSPKQEMEKCGDMVAAKKSEVSSEKLLKFLKK
jgi:hypothetical protein